MRFLVPLAVFFGLITFSTATHGQSVQDWTYYDMTSWDSSPYKAYRFTSANGPMNFRLLYPNNYDPNGSKLYPMIIMLHGYGEAGRRNVSEFYATSDPRYDNNDHQLLHGGKEHLDAVRQGKFDGFVLFPQNDYGSWISGKGEASGSMQRDMAKMLELVEYLPSLHKIDLSRLYVHGLSNGAGGTWYASYVRPDLFAASAPMSHAGDPAMAPTLAYNPIWLFQGGLDTNPRPMFAEEMITALQNQGAKPRYTLYPNTGHGTWYQAYAEPDFFSWLSAQHKLNIWVKYGREAFCADEGFTATLGISPGFESYEWRRNGTLINGASSNSLTINEFGDYQVRVRRNGNWTDWGPVKSISEQGPSPSPKITAGLQSTALPDLNGNTSVTLLGSDGYARYRWSNGATSQNITVSAAGTYSLQAAEAEGCFSASSNSIVVTTSNGADSPAMPGTLTASAVNATTLNLSWADNAGNELQYEIWRSTTSGSNYSLIARTNANISSFTDTGLSPSTYYYYKVRAINNSGASAASNEAGQRTLDDTEAPSAPANLRVTSTNRTTINLVWDAANDNVGVKDYVVFRDGTQVGSVNSTSYAVSGLTEKTQYTFTVKARDNAGNLSIHSNQVAAATILNGLSYSYYEVEGMGALPNFSTLTPVKTGFTENFNLGVRNRNNDFALKFEGYINLPSSGTYTFYTSSDDGSKLYIGAFSENNLVVDNDGLHGSQERAGTIDLAAGVHRIYVTFFEASGGENLEVRYEGPGIAKQLIPASALKDDFTPPSPPAAPTELTASAVSPYQINLSWTDNSTDESGFELYRSLNASGPFAIITTTAANANSYSDLNLEPNTTYYYKVRAINTGGASAYAGGSSGLDYDYYEIANMSVVPDFASNSPVKSGNVANFSLSPRNRDEDFAFRYQGKIIIEEAGDYSFFTTSDDGSKLWINGTLVVDNDGLHGPTEKSGTLSLSKGLHDIQVGFFEKGGGELLEVRYSGLNLAKQLIPDAAFAAATFATTPPINTDPPAAASNLQATANGTSSVQLIWQDNSDNETGFLLERATVSGGPYTQIASLATDQTEYVDTGLSAHTFYEYRVIADNNGITASPSNVAGISTENTVPILNTIGNMSVQAGSSLSKILTVEDADDDDIQFSSNDLPSFAQLEKTGLNQAQLSLNPATGSEGEYVATIRVADDFGGEDTETITITVSAAPVNQAPVFAAVEDMAVNAGQSSSQEISATDNEGDTITLSISSGTLAFVSLTDNGDGTGLLLAEPQAGDEGSYTITLRAHDGQSYTEVSLNLEVSTPPANQAPVFEPVADMEVQAGNTATQTIRASDPENDALVLSLVSGAPAFASLTDYGDGSASLELNPQTGNEGSYTLQIEASDGTNITTEELTVNVLENTSGGSDEVVFRIDVGGGADVSDTPLAWERDDRSVPSQYLDPASSNNTAGASSFRAVNNTGAPDIILATMRFDYSWGGNLQYHFPTANGDYEVKLFFAESPYSYGATAAGQRVFDVYVEGQLGLDDYDIFAAAGKNADVRTLLTSVQDGTLDISFERVVGDPTLNGIEIVRKGSSTAATSASAKTGMAASASFSATTYPSTFTSSLSVDISSKKEQAVLMEVTDMMGRSYFTHHKHLPQGSSSYELQLQETAMPAGLYLLKIQSLLDGETELMKIIKQ